MILITGAAGLIGSAVVRSLNRKGREDLILVDHLGCDHRWRNLQSLRFARYYEKNHFLSILLQNTNQMKDIDCMIHLGANSSTIETNVSHLIENNVEYSITLAEYAIANNIRMVYASSAATYGNGKMGFNDDTDQLHSLRPLNAYGYSKHLFDLWLSKKHFKPKFFGLKYFNVYGSNEYHKQDMRSVVLKAFTQIQESGSIRLFKSEHPDYEHGKQVRDFLYCEDAATITNFFALTDINLQGGVYNIGSGKTNTWLDLAESLFAALKKKPNIKFIDMPKEIAKNYQYYTLANMNKTLATGAPAPEFSLQDGIKDYVDKYLLKDFKHA